VRRRHETGIAAEFREPPLELRAGIGRRLATPGKQGTERSQSAPSPASFEKASKRPEIEEPKPVGLLEGAPELARANDLGEIQQGTCDRSHGYPLVAGAVVGMEASDLVQGDTWTRAASPARCDDVYARAASRREAPESPSAAMAEHHIGTACQNRGHPASVTVSRGWPTA
jgi:hypothetical protein